ncbi:hypothetical protein FACS1894166_06690 [Bacilli bacterium]|nr:hypothetical protein FACS1894166_06690 [Bacilli bacterium]
MVGGTIMKKFTITATITTIYTITKTITSADKNQATALLLTKYPENG